MNRNLWSRIIYPGIAIQKCDSLLTKENKVNTQKLAEKRNSSGNIYFNLCLARVNDPDFVLSESYFCDILYSKQFYLTYFTRF